MSVAGIDLGNDTSCVALARKRGIDVILNKESKRETPAVASFGTKQRFLGSDGLGAMATNMKNTIYQLKRLLGKKFSSPAVQHDLKGMPFTVTEAPNGGCLVHVDYLGEPATFTPEQIVAMLLLDKKAIAERDQDGLPITDCVIGVPSYFTEAERAAMLDAAKIAGLNCLRTLNETTATALAYGIYKTDLPESEPVHVAFVDMGHSSLQVSVVAFKKGQLRVLTHTWDRDLGGRDFDAAVLKRFAEEWKTTVKLDVTNNKKACHRALLQIEKVKKMLSANPEAPLNIECLMDDKDVRAMMTRDMLEEVAAPLLERVRATLQAAVAQCGLTPDQVAAVEVIGSATRTPAVMNCIREAFGKEPSRTMNAKECVSRGCALACAMISPLFRVKDFEVVDAVPYSVAVQWESKDKGTVTQTLFPRNSEHVPSKSKLVTFLRSEPFEVRALYAEDSLLPEGSSRDLGVFHVGPFAVPAGQETATIKLQFKLDLHGMIKLEAAFLEEKLEEPAPEGEAAEEDAPKTKTKVRKTDVPFSVSASRGMSKAELDEAVEREAQMSLQDRIQEETADRKNALEAYVYSMRNKVGGAYADFVGEAERAEFSRRLDDMENWLYDEGEDLEKKVYIEKLEELKKIGDPIAFRANEADRRGPVAESLRTLCRNYLAVAQSDSPQYAHIEAGEKNRVVSECSAALQWLDEKLKLQEQTPKTQPPALTVADMDKRGETVERVCKPIMSKPAPKPTPPPAPAPTPAAESEPMETDELGAEEGPQVAEEADAEEMA